MQEPWRIDLPRRGSSSDNETDRSTFKALYPMYTLPIESLLQLGMGRRHAKSCKSQLFSMPVLLCISWLGLLASGVPSAAFSQCKPRIRGKWRRLGHMKSCLQTMNWWFSINAWDKPCSSLMSGVAGGTQTLGKTWLNRLRFEAFSSFWDN